MLNNLLPKEQPCRGSFNQKVSYSTAVGTQHSLDPIIQKVPSIFVQPSNARVHDTVAPVDPEIVGRSLQQRAHFSRFLHELIPFVSLIFIWGDEKAIEGLRVWAV